MRFNELTWEYFIAEINSIEELSSNERIDFVRSLEYFRELFGPLETSPVNVHFYFRLMNRAPWTRREIIRQASAIRILEKCINFDKLVKHLSTADNFIHDLTLALFCEALVRQGVHIRFEPTRNVDSRNKQPDAMLTMPNGCIIYLEVATQHMSGPDKEAQETSHSFFDLFIGGPVTSSIPHDSLWSAALYKTLSPARQAEVANKIIDASKCFITSDGFYAIEEDYVFSVAFASKENINLLKQWCDERCLQVGTLQGVPPQSDSSLRLREKIRKEIKQLPENHPCIILIHGPLTAFTEAVKMAFAAQIEEEVYRYTNLLMVILQTEYLGGSGIPTSQKIGKHWLYKRYHDLIATESIIILNDYSDYKETELANIILRMI